MSDETTEGGPKKGKQTVLLVGAIAFGLAAGGGGGVFAAKALLGGTTASAAAPAAGEAAPDSAGAEEAGHGKEAEAGHGDEKGSHSAPGAVHTVSDMVLNPAQSGGSRFLMVSVAIGVGDEATAKEMEGRDAELRDAILTVLGGKTVNELADIARRDSLKMELKQTVGALVPGGKVSDVFFPQYVIQ